MLEPIERMKRRLLRLAARLKSGDTSARDYARKARQIIADLTAAGATVPEVPEPGEFPRGRRPSVADSARKVSRPISLRADTWQRIIERGGPRGASAVIQAILDTEMIREVGIDLHPSSPTDSSEYGCELK